MGQKIETRILQVPLPLVGAMWPIVAPQLLRGVAASDGDLKALVDDIVAGVANLWVITDDGDLLGVFVTAIIEDDSGRAVDVYGLSGRKIERWGHLISERMNAYAKANECGRVLFCGRKGLLRTYEGVSIVGEHSPGIFQFERIVS